MRIVFITRRFWPLLGGAETVIANLSAALVARGMKATILTAQWQHEWPREIGHRGVRVVRLTQPPRRVLGTWRYMRELAGWLGRHRDEYDLVFVSQLKHDAYVAVRVGRRRGFPVVLRATGAGLTGDCHWHSVGRCGRMIRRQAQRATAVIAPSPAIEAELLAAGFSAAAIVPLANGVPTPEPRDAARRAQARQTIAEVNPALSLSADTPLAVFTGRLHEAKGLEHLVKAWSIVARRVAGARLWLVGEGPEHERLVGQIQALGLSGRIALAGSFDSVDDVLAAADLFVLPSDEEGMSLSLLEAMAAGLPIVASDIPGNRNLVTHGREGLLVPPRDSAALAGEIEELLSRPDWATGLGAAARRRVQQHFSLERMVDDHLALFSRLLDKTP